MGAQGTTSLNFGAFPGSSVASVDVAATGVVVTSAVEAWIRPEASADHTDGDHVAANMRIVGHYLSDGNIRIWGLNNNDITPPLEPSPVVGATGVASTARVHQTLARQPAPMLVGTFNVNWAWN